MVASIGKIASPAQGVGYFEKDGYYAREDGTHREASAWAGKGAEALGLEGPVDPEAFRRVLEGEVPGGRRLGRKELDGGITHRPGRDVTVEAAERAISALERDGALHGARGLGHGKHWTTDAALARESETIALMRAGRGAEKTVMRRWVAETKLHRGRLNEGQKEAVKTILAGTDRVVGVQGYAGTGKTTMLKRLRALGESRGYRTIGLAPSASAENTLANESGIRSETLQRFLARHDGIAQGRGTADGLRKLRAANAKTMLVVDESSLASSAQMRNLMRIATALRLPRMVLVGDEKQLGAVEAGKPFAQLKAAGMRMAVMDDIVRQRDADLKAAVKAGLAGDVKTAFAKLGGNIRQVDYGDLGRATGRRGGRAISPAPRAGSRSTGARRWSCAGATGCASPATIRARASRTARPRRWNRSGTAAWSSASTTARSPVSAPATPSSGTSTAPSLRPSTPSRAGRWTGSSRR